MDDDILDDSRYLCTADLALAAALALYFPLVATDRYGLASATYAYPRDYPVEGFDGTGELTYVFQRHDQLDDLVAQYEDGELLVEPRAYAEQLRRLEARDADDRV